MQITRVENFLKKNLFICLYLTFSFGVIKCAAKITGVLYNYIARKINIHAICQSLYDWAALPAVDHPIWDYKLPSLLFYVLALIGLGIFYGIGLTLIRQEKPLFKIPADKKGPWFGLICFSSALLLNLIFLLTHICSQLILVCWIIAFLSLCLFPYWSQISLQIAKIKINRWVVCGLILAMVVQFFLIFYPYIFKPMFFANDYMDIPEQTILSKNKIVDNTAYINAHGIGGLDKYDPRTDLGKTPFPQHKTHITLAQNARLDAFIQDGKRRYQYAYDNDRQMLSVSGAMPLTDLQELNALYAGDLHSLKSISDLYVLSQNNAKSLQTKSSTLEEQAFIQKNERELFAQTKEGWILFHHSWFLNPINAISLGAPVQTQQLIYGWLNTVFLEQLMEWRGEISYQTYFEMSYGFYPLYYLLFLMTVFLIFRKIEFVAIGAALLSTSYFGLGDLLIRLAPGHNPNRHFFDMIAFLLLYLYTKSNRLIYFFCSLALCIFSILWNKDFGICLLLSISAALILHQCIHVKISYSKLIFLVLISVLGVWVYVLPIHGNCHNFIYSLLGLGVPITPLNLIVILLLGINALYLVYVFQRPVDKSIYIVSIGLFFYCQLELIYFVWNPSLGHILSITASPILLVLTWLQLLRPFAMKHKYLEKQYLTLLLVFILMVLYLPSALKFYSERADFNKLADSHVTHFFDMPGAKFHSTMEPQLFEQTSDLINRYEKHPAMYLISKYDAILPLLTRKYNAIPSVSVSLDLISPVDTSRFMNAITQNNPQYIFIDTDIARNRNGDIYAENPVLSYHDASQDRVDMLSNMTRLYHDLLNRYEPVEVGSLITVYRRKQA